MIHGFVKNCQTHLIIAATEKKQKYPNKTKNLSFEKENSNQFCN